ncbi:MAG: hypothetical protein PVI23_17030, partial [Maricaulaceae bacterium]|jgi:hypothetical protein
VQNSAPPKQLGVATSTVQFFRQIGSTIGVAIFGALLIHELSVQFARVMPGVNIDLGQLRALTVTEGGGPITVPPAVQEAFASTMTVLFLAGILITALAAATTLLIPHEPLRDHFTPKAEPVAEPGEGEHDVTQAGKGRRASEPAE